MTRRPPRGRARPQRTKEHVGAEEGAPSGRHKSSGGPGPALRSRPPWRRGGPLGQCSAARPAGPDPPPSPQHGAARAPAGTRAAASVAAAGSARAAGRRRRGRGAASGLQARRAAPRDRQGGGRRGGQGGVQQPGARAGPAPGHAAQPHGHPVSSPRGAALLKRPVPSLLPCRRSLSCRFSLRATCKRVPPAPLCLCVNEAAGRAGAGQGPGVSAWARFCGRRADVSPNCLRAPLVCKVKVFGFPARSGRGAFELRGAT